MFSVLCHPQCHPVPRPFESWRDRQKVQVEPGLYLGSWLAGQASKLLFVEIQIYYMRKVFHSFWNPSHWALCYQHWGSITMLWRYHFSCHVKTVPWIHHDIDPGRDVMAVLWEEWLHSSEDWSRSTYATSLKKTSSSESMGCRRWMTKGDILKKYDGNAELCDAMVHAKESDPVLSKSQIKPHPDAPSCRNLGFYVKIVISLLVIP